MSISIKYIYVDRIYSDLFHVSLKITWPLENFKLHLGHAVHFCWTKLVEKEPLCPTFSEFLAKISSSAIPLVPGGRLQTGEAWCSMGKQADPHKEAI